MRYRFPMYKPNQLRHICYLMMSLYSDIQVRRVSTMPQCSVHLCAIQWPIFRCIVDGFVGVGFIALLSKLLKIEM